MKPITILLPDQSEKKLQELQEYYLNSGDTMIQKIVIDRLDDIYEAVILEPKRKDRS